ncbi:MAG: hypothetical protein Q9170_005012 [Blastenia crenularia]
MESINVLFRRSANRESLTRTIRDIQQSNAGPIRSEFEIKIITDRFLGYVRSLEQEVQDEVEKIGQREKKRADENTKRQLDLERELDELKESGEREKKRADENIQRQLELERELDELKESGEREKEDLEKRQRQELRRYLALATSNMQKEELLRDLRQQNDSQITLIREKSAKLTSSQINQHEIKTQFNALEATNAQLRDTIAAREATLQSSYHCYDEIVSSRDTLKLQTTVLADKLSAQLRDSDIERDRLVKINAQLRDTTAAQEARLKIVDIAAECSKILLTELEARSHAIFTKVCDLEKERDTLRAINVQQQRDIIDLKQIRASHLYRY